MRNSFTLDAKPQSVQGKVSRMKVYDMFDVKKNKVFDTSAKNVAF